MAAPPILLHKKIRKNNIFLKIKINRYIWPTKMSKNVRTSKFNLILITAIQNFKIGTLILELGNLMGIYFSKKKNSFWTYLRINIFNLIFWFMKIEGK